MGRYIKQTETRSELQQRIAAEMRAKAEARAKQEGFGAGDGAPERDGIEDSAYIKGTKQTTSLAWVWLIIFFAIVGLFINFVLTTQ